MHNAPADDPSSPAGFAARADGVCQNSARLAVPLPPRLLASRDPAADPQAAKAAADLLAQLSSTDRDLAKALASLTPPVSTQGEVLLTVDALRRFADARDKLGEAFAARSSGATKQATRSFGRARQSYQAAARDARLEAALRDCL